MNNRAIGWCLGVALTLMAQAGWAADIGSHHGGDLGSGDLGLAVQQIAGRGHVAQDAGRPLDEDRRMETSGNLSAEVLPPSALEKTGNWPWKASLPY